MITLEDRDQLRELFARLAHNLDSGEAEAYADDYTHDGTFRATGVPEAPGGTVRCTGRSELMGFVKMVAGEARRGFRHWNDSFVFTDDGEGRVIVDSYLVQLAAGTAPGARVLLTGRYRDTLVKQGDRWLMFDRSCVCDQSPA